MALAMCDSGEYNNKTNEGVVTIMGLGWVFDFREEDLTPLVSEVIERGAIKPRNNYSLIRKILWRERYDLILRLIDAGMRIEPDDYSTMYGDYSTYVLLSELSDKIYATPELLTYAVLRGWWQLVDNLIAQGIKIDETLYECQIDYRGSVRLGVLHNSAWESNANTVRTLLQNGADVHKRDFYGETALMRACRFSLSRQAKTAGTAFWLLHYGADPRVKGPTGSSSLLLCTEAHLDSDYDVIRAQIAELLLAYGADPNEMSTAKTTPLMFAARDNNQLLTQVLLRNGADRTIKSPSGKTALDVAVERGSTGVVAMLNT